MLRRAIEVTRPALWIAAALAATSCDKERPSTSPGPDVPVQSAAALAPTDAAVDTGAVAPTEAPAVPTVDPNPFPRNGCLTQASPPHIVTGTATVTWRTPGSSAFSYRNLPARCGAATPAENSDGHRSRPGDGAEFVVCMPDERRLDVGITRLAPVAPGPQDVSHLPNSVRLRLVLTRYVNVVTRQDAPDPTARLTFGPRLYSASGSVPLGTSLSGPPVGTLEFEIDCNRRPGR